MRLPFALLGLAPLPTLPDPPAATAAEAPAPEPTRTRAQKRAQKRKQKIPHGGFTVDFRVGMLGCLKSVCADKHRADTPGIRLDGFLGGNIKGFVDIGIAGGWGKLQPDVAPGTNMLTLYGVDPVVLAAELPPYVAQMVPWDAFDVLDAKLQTAQGGPSVRVHFVPRGRVLVYVGSGAQYNLFRADYHTTSGAVRVDLHGIAVPVELGLGVHVLRNLALVAHFDWRWTWYGLAVLDNPVQRLTVPLSFLVDTARQQGFEIRKELPQFWTLGLALRARV